MSGISILGVPNDDHSSFMRGCAGAPALVRRELISDVHSSWTENGFDLLAPGRLHDLGDVVFEPQVDPWIAIDRAVTEALMLMGPLIAIGGDHAITHPIVRAVRRQHPKLTIIHIDAHPDIYDNYQDDPRSHTSPFARIMEERLADRLIQVGLRTINDHHRAQFLRFDVEAFPMSEWDRQSWQPIEGPIYLSMDIDALDPSCAPGVGHREPGGLSVRQVIDFISGIRAPIVAADIVEFNPLCDIFGLTATVAAKLTKEIAGVMLAQRDAA